MMDGHEVYTSEEIINLVKDNKIETLRSILSNDADSKILDSTRDWAGDGLLALACWHERVEIALMLIDEFHANINEKNNAGSTPLHRACDHGNRDILRLLCDRGANITATDKAGKTPFDYGSSDTKEYLRERQEVESAIVELNMKAFEAAEKEWDDKVKQQEEMKKLILVRSLCSKAVSIDISMCNSTLVNGIYDPIENSMHCLCPVYQQRHNHDLYLLFQSKYTPSLPSSWSPKELFWSCLEGQWVIMEKQWILSRCPNCSLKFEVSTIADSFIFDVSLGPFLLSMDSPEVTFPELRAEGANGVIEYVPAAGADGRYLPSKKPVEIVIVPEEVSIAAQQVLEFKSEIKKANILDEEANGSNLS